MRHRKAQLRPRTARKDRKAKIVGYGLQLREKQKVRRIYGVLEAQFRNTFEKAVKMKGITGEKLLGTLERRLDNVVYRMGLGASRAQARQIVRHGHIQVNGSKVNIPSCIVKPGDEISVRESSKNKSDHPFLARRHGPRARAQLDGRGSRESEGPHQQQPAARRAGADSINEQLIVELYSK